MTVPGPVPTPIQASPIGTNRETMPQDQAGIAFLRSRSVPGFVPGRSVIVCAGCAYCAAKKPLAYLHFLHQPHFLRIYVAGLLNRYRVEKPYRGFESLSLRHIKDLATFRTSQTDTETVIDVPGFVPAWGLTR